jgi:hypothetical protein
LPRSRRDPLTPPFVMVNLLKFKESGGLEGYQQYGREAARHLERVGATIRYGGTAPAVLLGEGNKPWWDAILIVEYPTPAAFLEMVTDPDYPHATRTAALDRGDLIATSLWTEAEQFN